MTNSPGPVESAHEAGTIGIALSMVVGLNQLVTGPIYRRHRNALLNAMVKIGNPASMEEILLQAGIAVTDMRLIFKQLHRHDMVIRRWGKSPGTEGWHKTYEISPLGLSVRNHPELQSAKSDFLRFIKSPMLRRKEVEALQVLIDLDGPTTARAVQLCFEPASALGNKRAFRALTRLLGKGCVVADGDPHASSTKFRITNYGRLAHRRHYER